MMKITRISARASLVGSVVLLASCGDILDVENPGSIADEDLSLPVAMPGLVTGMSFDLSRAVDAVLQNSNIMADDLYHGGSYGPQGLFNRGIIDKEDVNGMWGSMHRARWVAESGIERMKTVMGEDYDTSPLGARANLYAGFANRWLGEHVCEAVIDGGPREDFTVHFERAEEYFTEALRVAAGIDDDDVRDSLTFAAYGGRASARAWLGNWTEAVADAANVPEDYLFVALFSTNTPDENNDLVFETDTRLEYTVFNTQWAQVFNDPRVPWDTLYTEDGDEVESGQDGSTPFFQQKKYVGLGADVPLTKGTEMLMLRAEERLRAGDVTGAMGFVNQQRALFSLPALTATTAAEAWPILKKERAAVLWMEGRRLWDLRRWNAEAPPIKDTFLDDRDKCIPVSENEEQSNPNV
jgi:hypothetical protein